MAEQDGANDVAPTSAHKKGATPGDRRTQADRMREAIAEREAKLGRKLAFEEALMSAPPGGDDRAGWEARRQVDALGELRTMRPGSSFAWMIF